MFQLAMTAALEHYTATMARTFLNDAALTELFVDDEFLRFWVWHAIEESEHRAVAFDVFCAVGGEEELRLRAIRISSLLLTFIAVYHTVIGVLRDPRTWFGLALPRSLWRLRTNPFLSAGFRAAINDYKRIDFHPLQHDTSPLETEWRAWVEGSGDRPQLGTS
jgi:predicted metal-dependent hydrolase